MYCLFSNNVHETENIKDHPAIKKTHLLSNRPELAFHAGEFKMRIKIIISVRNLEDTLKMVRSIFTL